MPMRWRKEPKVDEKFWSQLAIMAFVLVFVPGMQCFAPLFVITIPIMLYVERY